MEFLWNKLTEWLKEMLVGGVMSNLTGLFDSINEQVSEIAGTVGTTLQGWNSGVFSMVQSLSNNVVVPIAGVLLAIVMAMELIQMIVDRNNMNDFDVGQIVKWVCKSFFDKRLGDRTKLPQREAIRILIDDALAQKPADLDALLELLKAAGCEIKHGKQISIRGPGQSCFKRLDTLGEAYDLPALTAILAGERQHQHKQQRQTPAAGAAPKVNLLVDIQAQLRASKGPGYERWAKRFNIK